MGPCHPGCLVNHAGNRARARVARESCKIQGLSDPSASIPGQLFDTRALGHCPEYPVISGRPRGPLEPGPSRPGELVDPAGHRALACVAQDSG